MVRFWVESLGLCTQGLRVLQALCNLLGFGSRVDECVYLL